MKLSVFVVLHFVLLVSVVLSDLNNEGYRNSCKPASCSIENDCYCTDRENGWFNGGWAKMRDLFKPFSSFCMKLGVGDCKCDDCGSAGTQCQDKRCHDEIGLTESNVCYHVNPSTGEKTRQDTQYYFHCYRRRVKCNSAACGFGKTLKGCMRVSPGACVDCPALTPGHFWPTEGSCDQQQCASPLPGQFVGKACTSTTDTVLASCAQHPGNPGHVVPRQDGRATYYCPGGGLVLPLPPNSVPTPDYSGFVCVEGYYLDGTSSCIPCPPGFACRHGRRFQCPEHYYASAFAMSECRRCTTPGQCQQWESPARCRQGSTSDPGCMACGGCSYDSRQGLACVVDQYEMQGLPDRCRPADAPGAVARCV